jgi:hypothetical protein
VVRLLRVYPTLRLVKLVVECRRTKMTARSLGRMPVASSSNTIISPE